MASIIVTTPSGEESHYRLGKGPIVIGRGENVPIQIVDDHVSTKHVQIRFDSSGESYRVLDMKSKNGTKINSRRLTEDVELVDGDVIRIGESTITFYDRDFVDRSNAFEHHKKAGERYRGTEMYEER